MLLGWATGLSRYHRSMASEPHQTGRSRMRTVYIMGAGASAHVGYPLISNMGKQLLEWMSAYPSRRYRSSAELLTQKFGAVPNIENVIAQIEDSISTLTDSDIREDMVQRVLLVSARSHMYESLREWFREIHLNPAIAYA